jgi:hypothetical protein
MNGWISRAHRLWRALAVVVVAAVAWCGQGAVAWGASQAPREVVQVACSAPAWNWTAGYPTGAVVSHRGHQWRANHEIWPGLEPGSSGAPPWWVPWADLGPCGAAPTTTTKPPSTTTTTQPPGSTTTTVPPGGNVEDTYAAAGPWAVTTGTVTVPGATTGPVALFYPTNLGTGGVDHPILTYAAGTGWTIQPDDPTLRHLASWGYVVAGISSPGSGADVAEADSLRAAADFLVAQGSNSSSTFFGRLDTRRIGALGHSQGAGATILLMGSTRNADGLYSSAAPLALPSRSFWCGCNTPNYALVTDPIVFLSGTSDFLTSASEQTFFFNSVAGPAAKAAAVGADHNATQTASRGYLTAWFKYTLEGDASARRAFVATGGSPPQISTDPQWTNWAAKNLP